MKITVNPNNLSDVLIEQWAINQDPEVGHEEPEQVSISVDDLIYVVNIKNASPSKKVWIDVWSTTETGEQFMPIKRVNISGDFSKGY